jgi:hypothetical protein
MPTLEILDTGLIDQRDSAFPQSVQLPNGDILCSFCVGGGQFVHGGTECARSTDGGRTWDIDSVILPPKPEAANFLKLTLSPDAKCIYAYGTRYFGPVDDRFGTRRGDAVFCRSIDGGKSWSPPQVIPMPYDGATEISHGLLPLASGRLLAPAASLAVKERLGERVFTVVSDDGGKTWPRVNTVFQDRAGKLGFWEQKLAEYAPNRLIAVAWTVTLGDYSDRPDSFALSDDGGETWSDFRSTGIMGQTMTPIPLGGDRLLVLYNLRYGEQGIVGCLVTFTPESWTVHAETLMYDARRRHDRRPDQSTGVDELVDFAFGFPTAIRLQDGTYLATHWCVEQKTSGIRWTRLRIDW